MDKKKFRIDSKEANRIFRFLVVGTSGTIIDFSLLSILKTLGLPTLPANTFSFLVGVINNFTWNRLWTFSDSRGNHWNKQIWKFVFVSIIGLLINNLVIFLLEGWFDQWFVERGYIPAKMIATGIAVIWNYCANRLWTFRRENYLA
jgi:putative flippase GtrA